MKAMEWIVIITVVAGALALIHAGYLYFFVYGDVIHSHLTPKEWFSMYGINVILIVIAGVVAEILNERSR